MMEQTATVPTDYVAVFANGAVVYVIVADRKKFDEIQKPVTDHTTQLSGLRVLTKSVGDHGNPCMVIFQHWLTDAAATLNVEGAA